MFEWINRMRPLIEDRSRQCQRSDPLMFSELLSEEQIQQAYDRLRQQKNQGPSSQDEPSPPRSQREESGQGDWTRDRVYPLHVTLWMLLTQARSEDRSLRQAVMNQLAWRSAHGMSACSSRTGAYSQARQKLPEELPAELTRQTGGALHGQAPPPWLWKGREVAVADGATVTMDDTPVNQQQYPQRANQAPGLGFPILRLVVIFSLAVGVALDAAITATKGKKTGECTLFRELAAQLRPGTVLVADCEYESYRNVAFALQHGLDVVFAMNASRRCDFRRGRRLGRKDHVIVWTKPQFNAERMTRQEYDALPEQIEIRELEYTISQKGFRSKRQRIVTTLLDAKEYSGADLAELYRRRWHAELDLNALKTTLAMEHIPARTPAMVRKMIWAHLLSYNLLRGLNASAAVRVGVEPRTISFKAAKQSAEAFFPKFSGADEERLLKMFDDMLGAIAQHRVADRPDRFGPRAVKKRNNKYPKLKVPRSVAVQQLAT